MKKNFFLVALSALTLAACTNDEVIEESKDEIKFAVATETSTRAGAVATTTNTIDNFKLWAYTKDTKQLYIEKEFKKKDENGNIYKYWGEGNLISTPYFWPEEALNFYAISPSTTTVDFTATAQEISDYTVDGSTDLLYAVNLDETNNPNVNTTVALNFRHALAQLVFRARNENNYIGVDINGLKVAQVNSKGTLTLTNVTDNTGSNLSEDKGTATETPTTTWGVWSEQATIQTYEANIKPLIDLSTLNRPIFLTKNTEDKSWFDKKEYIPNEEGLYVLPQSLQNWDPATEPDLSSSTEAKAYFLISCRIWNKPTGKEASSENVVWLWGDTDEYKEVAIPVVAAGDTDAAWKQGMKYTYTFVFGKGAGYVPPTGEENSGDPVLVPIKLELTVDEFQSANNTIDMGTEE